MIDIHCHLLPGIDDGAQDQETALAMMRLAIEDGIESMVFTPHIHPERHANTRRSIDESLQDFQETLDDAGISMRTAAAAEVRISPEIPAMVDNEQIPYIGHKDGCQVFLLEFPHSHIPPGSEKLVDWLLAQDIRPMIAHPERNKDVIRDVGKIWPYVSAGCLLQLTAGSVAGTFGEIAQQRSLEMLEKGWVTVLASDAHNIQHRPPVLQAGREAAAAIVGEAESWRLVREYPWSIVESLFQGKAA